MKNTASNIQQVVNGAQGRFISVLVKDGINRQSFSAKIHSVSDKYITFTDTNSESAPNRRVRTQNVLRVACGQAIYSKVKV
jgi:hypothetical protein|tara:strand:+ start:2348 stop:2590 length:243 start_codon:yes stop_codon:yes gene_type:complete